MTALKIVIVMLCNMDLMFGLTWLRHFDSKIVIVCDVISAGDETCKFVLEVLTLLFFCFGSRCCFLLASSRNLGHLKYCTLSVYMNEHL